MSTNSRIERACGPAAFALLVVAALCCRVPEAVFSPDGERVAFVRLDDEAVAGVHVAALPDGAVREVLRLGPPHGMLRPIFDDAGDLWVLAARDEPQGFDVYAVRDGGPERVIAVDGPEADAGFLFPACIVGGRWLWAAQLQPSDDPAWQRMDLTSGEVDAPFGELLVLRALGPAGEYALTLREGEEAAADASSGDKHPGKHTEVVPPEVRLVRLDLAGVRMAELFAAEPTAFAGPGRELAVFSQLAVGVGRLALVVQSPEAAWKGDGAAGDSADDATPDADADATDVADDGARTAAGRIAPRAAEVVLLDLDGQELERLELAGVRLVSGHRLSGDDRWLWALALVGSGQLVLLRHDLRAGTREQLVLGDAATSDADELFFQARLGGSRDGRRLSLQLLGEDVGAPRGRVLVFDGEAEGPLVPVARFGDDG